MWDESQWSAVAKHWLGNSCLAKAVVDIETGRLVYANATWEQLVGYTEFELQSQWDGLYPNVEMSDLDRAMVAKVLTGDRPEYTIIREFKNRDGVTQRVRQHVQRYPPGGKPSLALVTVIPMADHMSVACEQTMVAIGEMRQDVRQLVSTVTAMAADPEVFLLLRPLVKIVGKYPKISVGVGLFVLLLVLGDSGIELVRKVMAVMGWIDLKPIE